MPAIVSIKDPTLQTHTQINPEVLKDFPFELVTMARAMFVKACSAVWKRVGFPSLAKHKAEVWLRVGSAGSQGISVPGLASTGFIHGRKHLVAMCLCPPTPVPPRSWHPYMVTVPSRITGLREGNMMFPNFVQEAMRNNK